MKPQPDQTCIAFADSRKIASGDVREVALKVKQHLQQDRGATVLVFDGVTSLPIELDLRGTPEAVLRRLTPPEEPSPEEKKSGPGRPKLGVVAREVTLLPQHWEWLAAQPGGASVTLRKLVEEARKKNAHKDRIRQAQDAAYKFMMVMAGNLPDYEEALRALYAKDARRFEALIKPWPKDIRDHVTKLARPVMEG